MLEYIKLAFSIILAIMALRVAWNMIDVLNRISVDLRKMVAFLSGGKFYISTDTEDMPEDSWVSIKRQRNQPPRMHDYDDY